MRITEDDLCAHVDELIDEEESAFEHLLVNQHGTFGLCGCNKEHAEQVRCESRPWSIADVHY